MSCIQEIPQGPAVQIPSNLGTNTAAEEDLDESTGSNGIASEPLEQRGGMDDGIFAYAKSEQGEGLCRRQRNKEALQQVNLEDCIKGLIMTQIREAMTVHDDVGLMGLLQICLEVNHQEKEHSSVVALSGYIEHFESRQDEDLGWGCGWRNIQMLSSYMLAQNPEAKEVLFGGAGFVPDIPAMQRWLEIAWLKGFDVLGADYFDWKISGTHKWIGTTECAALLRSFGVRARIIDFRTASSKRVGRDVMRGKGGSHTEKPSDGVASEQLTGDFDRMTISSGPSEGQASEASHIRESHFPHGKCVVELPDQKEALHFARRDPDNSNICLTCVEERKNSTFSHHLQPADHVEFGTSLDITGEQRNDDSSAGGGGGAIPSGLELNHKYMTDWIWNYFSIETGPSPRSITSSTRSPLYFQHRGHSRTIVGIERCKKEGSSKEEDYLIVLDPSQRTADIFRSLRRRQGWQELVKRGMHTLDQAEYQLCYIEPGIAMGEEMESLKTLSSVRYMY